MEAFQSSLEIHQRRRHRQQQQQQQQQAQAQGVPYDGMVGLLARKG